MGVRIAKGDGLDRDDFLRALARVQYRRQDLELGRGGFRVRGDTVDVFPVYEDERVVRVRFLGDVVEALELVDPLTGEVLEEPAAATIYPSSHYVTPQDRLASARLGRVVHPSATPGPWETGKAAGRIVEQVIRPTGLVDPAVEVRPARGQVDDLLAECRATVKRGFRVLVTTLTKRMAEELTDYLSEAGLRVRYLHADVEVLERSEILRDLRLGTFDVLVGVNLLREGLDLAGVALGAILDAGRAGFLRSDRSLVQNYGRAARNVEGRRVVY